ncbi:hypothetical protein [Trichothermofontia sp.]
MLPAAASLIPGCAWLLLTVPIAPLRLPPPEEVPEEVLRMEIITDVRSPITGKPMSAADYAEFQAQQQENPNPELSLPAEARHVILLLQLRRALRSILPF